MTPRKHVNLFVPDSPIGAICSSVIHEWAKDKYDSVTVVFCDGDSVEEEIHNLARLIHVAEREKANPCSERMIIVVGFYLSMSCFNELTSIANTKVRVHDSWVADEPAEKIMKRYFGFFKNKWHHGYRSLHKAISAGFLFGFRWDKLYEFHEIYGADELEKCLTAYLHDIDESALFNVYDMIDYYYDIFKERKQNASNQTEHF